MGAKNVITKTRQGPFMLSFLRLVLLTAFTVLASLTPALAQEKPIAFEADDVTVNQEDGSMYAVGNVILRQAGMELVADEVTYNRQSDTAVARGNVVMTTADKTVHRAPVMTLDTEFTHIVAEMLRSKFVDGSFFAADNADTVIGDKSVFNGSRFSPCKCDFENGETPIWDMRASSTTHYAESATIVHRNVRMHVLNIPVGYLPYLAHPDWTVRRRSGLLAPSFVISSDKGVTSSIPYFKVIDDTRDIEFTPYKFQYRGTGLRTRYRQMWDESELGVSLYTANVNTYKKNRENVAAIDASFNTDIGDDWDVKAIVKRTSQDTFARRYGFMDDTRLKSSVMAERIKSDRYYLVEASDIQGLGASDTPDREPTVLPRVFYEKTQPGFRKNQRMRTEISAIQLDNDEGHDMARWSGTAELSEDFIAGPGIASYRANVTGTYYSLHKKPASATTRTDDLGQVNPSASLGWRVPVAVTGMGRSAIVEPQVQLVHVAGPDRTKDVPNRDAADYRIDEANLFLLNRYQGKDYVMPGTRADVGLSAVSEDAILGEVSGFIGVSRRLSGGSSTGLATNQNDIYSDYVASVKVDPDGPYFVRWSGRMASHDFELNESKTTFGGNLGKANFTIEHNQLTKAYFASSSQDREELSASVAVPLPKGWNAKATQVWDLSNKKTVRDKTSGSLVWTGGPQDCLSITFDYTRDPTKDRDISRSDEIKFTLNFKYLGSLAQDDLIRTGNK